MTQCEEIEVCGMSQSASVIESEDVEEESDEEDQEAHDQCQNVEVGSSAISFKLLWSGISFLRPHGFVQHVYRFRQDHGHSEG